ncbi:MAG: hypothetical protein IT262_07785 [Saprospiraceae bacterium]|nr:hypothetical protein [Saprospiraceae bacterium]
MFAATVLVACNNQPVPTSQTPALPDPSAMLKHKYWVSKPFNDALFATNIIDTLSNLPCGELVFGQKDSLLMTACLSDAGRGTFKVTSSNSLEIVFEGFEGNPSKAQWDEKTGVLHIDPPGGPDTGWPTDFVAQDDIDVSNIDNVTINLGRKRLAGNYSILPKKGEVAMTALLELHTDGTQVGFGDFDTYEPWPSGIGGGFIQNPQRNLMYLVKKGKESDPTAVAWQVRGDTLRIWNTRNIGAEGDLPEYKIAGLKGTYIKAK